MDTWSTISSVKNGKYSKAIQVLESLSHDFSIPILDCLHMQKSVSMEALQKATGFDLNTLELQLELLCQAGAVKQRNEKAVSYYEICESRIQSVAAIANKLNALRSLSPIEVRA